MVYSLHSKRFRAVSVQRRTEERDSLDWREPKNERGGGGGDGEGEGLKDGK